MQPWNCVCIQDLREELRSELSGDFLELVMALLDNPAKYDAQQLRNAMEVTGCLFLLFKRKANILSVRNPSWAKLCIWAMFSVMTFVTLSVVRVLAKYFLLVSQGLGTDERSLTEILCSRNTFEITAAKDQYRCGEFHAELYVSKLSFFMKYDMFLFWFFFWHWYIVSILKSAECLNDRTLSIKISWRVRFSYVYPSTGRCFFLCVIHNTVV